MEEGEMTEEPKVFLEEVGFEQGLEGWGSVAGGKIILGTRTGALAISL